jgi:F0F1-type ATP synthase membrane subunit c/vacuolar-type H+-ATPase subunit K
MRMVAANASRMATTKRCCGKPLGVICILAVAICALILGLSVGLPGDKSVEAVGEAPSTETTPNTETRLLRTIALLSQVSDPKELQDLDSPRRRAAEWLADEDPAKLDVPETVSQGREFIERYIAALIHHSMDGPSWEVQLDFLSGKHVCEWQVTYPAENGARERKVGIGCSRGDMTVSDINLRKYLDVLLFASESK